MFDVISHHKMVKRFIFGSFEYRAVGDGGGEGRGRSPPSVFQEINLFSNKFNPKHVQIWVIFIASPTQFLLSCNDPGYVHGRISKVTAGKDEIIV